MSPFALALDSAAPGAGDPTDQLGGRLQRCARYVALLADQLDALKQHDAARLGTLAEERRRLEAELGIATAEASPASALPHRQLVALLDAGLDQMSRAVETDQRSREHWAALEDEARVAARGIPARRLGRYGAPAYADARLDLRF